MLYVFSYVYGILVFVFERRLDFLSTYYEMICYRQRDARLEPLVVGARVNYFFSPIFSSYGVIRFPSQILRLKSV